ncbi:chromatin complexes subunit BAP18 isoform X2 [Sitodiplosis mosellana]|uniref:chromatin complexes subunit BAP18 isoform X2 n=1 Tax=Sitodiplosis mosellana TaxID=263140 RepID=UPI002443B4B9|nr:chromatin complexes subunit BAP18 isoform X2 [Sitodiplosis mosellana]
MNSATKVGEIFAQAGAAFNRLGELTMQLHPTADSPAGSQIKQTLKKKAFEEAGIPVKQISLMQSPTHTAPETIFVKNDPQILSAIPSTSTAIIVTHPEPPAELMVPNVKTEEIHDEINLLTNPNATLLSSIDTPTTVDDSTDDSSEIKLEDYTSG